MPTSRFLFMLTAASALISVAAPAVAGEVQPFTIEAFRAAQAAGHPVLVDAHAGWCPICQRQKPTINAMASEPAFARLIIFKLNYDKQRKEKLALGIRQQSTLIAYAGQKETARSTGMTKPDKIRALAATALR